MATAETSYRVLRDLIDWLRGIVLRPRITVTYDARHTKDEARVADAGMRPACFYHLQVQNSGKVTARCCRGFLEHVESTTHPTNRLRKPEQLKWANELTLEPVDIEPGQTRRLDLVYVFRDEPKLHFFFMEPPLPAGTQRVFPPGIYRVAIRIAAENAKHGPVWFSVAGGQEWDGLEIDRA